MSGKFMKVKRIVIPTLTMIIIASQLMGCGAATQSEVLKMINEGEQIEIEVATPDFYESEQGEESPLFWEQLALLETNPTLRSSWDDILLITRTDTGKNGIFYVNAAGENENNNTMSVAIHNREFQKLFENASTLKSLADSAVSNYADLDISDTNNRNEQLKAFYMGINAYFNLLPDNTPNYCNADSTITRSQFMAMIFRADTPVQEIESDGTFTNVVGQSDYNIYAQGVTANSYLDLESKSLNNKTYNGNITRAEAIYTIVSRYYNDEMQSVNLNTTTVKFSDAKDGGDIATAQKFIEDGVKKAYWKSYELSYALQNADDGLPTELYKALVVAQQQGLLGTETRWDEAITLSESMELLVKALMNEQSTATYTAKLGTTNNYELALEEEAKELFNQHKDELICTESQFVTKYIDYRNTGLTKEQAWNTLYNEFANEYQTQTNENGEVVAEASEMDAVINSYDDNIEEEVAAPKENLIIDFEVEPLEPTNLYAIQSVNLRQGPSANDFEKIGSLSARQQVTVVGIVKEYQGEEVLWYQLDTGEFVSGAYLVENLPAETTPQQPQPSQGNTGQQSDDGYIYINGLRFDLSKGTTEGSGQVDGQATMDGDGSLANDGINWQ